MSLVFIAFRTKLRMIFMMFYISYFSSFSVMLRKFMSFLLLLQFTSPRSFFCECFRDEDNKVELNFISHLSNPNHQQQTSSSMFDLILLHFHQNFIFLFLMSHFIYSQCVICQVFVLLLSYTSFNRRRQTFSISFHRIFYCVT
jgi:hypothetical protein